LLLSTDRDRAHQDHWHNRHSRFHRSGPYNGQRERRCGQRGFRGHGRPHGHCRRNGNGCSPSVPSTPQADCFTQEELAVAEAIRISLTEVSDESINDAPLKEEADASTAPEERKTTEESAIESREKDIVVEASAPVDEVTEYFTLDDSFASDAAGSGDIAAVLGETLDKFAKAIDAVSSEFDRKPVAEEEEEGDNDDDDEDEEEEDFVIEAAEKGEVAFVDADEEEEFVIEAAEKEEEDFVDADEEEQGTKIIEGPDDDVKDDTSRDSWQVVAEDQQIEYDEAVARAAQMIGSALFNSDLANSAGEQLSTLSHSVASASSSSTSSSSGTSVSSATSVPTTVPSLGSTDRVPVAQLERWDMQLQQLHELGFYNDALCVDILERLTAANIGVDSQEEVTVTQVVNQLMKDW
jgi:hypothetical protein